MSIKYLLAAGCGSFLGGSLRFLISTWSRHIIGRGFPWGTWVVNIVGCFLIGLFMSHYQRTNTLSVAQTFWVTGILGGFTTFSAFSFESMEMIKRGEIATAAFYIISSLAIGLSATWVGWRI